MKQFLLYLLLFLYHQQEVPFVLTYYYFFTISRRFLLYLLLFLYLQQEGRQLRTRTRWKLMGTTRTTVKAFQVWLAPLKATLSMTIIKVQFLIDIFLVNYFLCSKSVPGVLDIRFWWNNLKPCFIATVSEC